jgi:large subunit ribosomal protein L27
MAHKKAGSSSKNGRDSVGQRLGVKVGDGQTVPAGSIIVRQRGMTFLAGTGTGLGRDYTVFATTTGKVRFEHATKSKKRIRVEAIDAPVTAASSAAKAAKAPAPKAAKPSAAKVAATAAAKAAKPAAAKSATATAEA